MPVLAVVLALATDGPPSSGASLASALLAGLVLQFVLTFVLNNWWEEVAWAGFVGPGLQERYDSTVRAR